MNAAPDRISPACEDGTLKEYQHLTPEESWQRLRSMARRVTEVGGGLYLLWHIRS